MAIIVVGDRIKNTKRNSVGVDEFYGPYEADEATNRSALQVAEDVLTSAHKMVPGQTVGIKRTDGSIVDYQVQPVNEGYGFVEKGTGTTDYNDLDNKPTISDGGQGSTQIPLAGNVKVTASTASGDTAGVTITQGQTAGEIEMQFTLPKGDNGEDGANGVTPTIDPTTKHWMMGNTDTNIVAEGQDGQNGAPGHNPCLGVFADESSLPSTDLLVGDYAYAEVSGVSHIFRYSGSAWVDNGEGSPDNQTAFDGGAGPTVASTKIDDTQLTNPASNAFAKATDVMPLAVKMKGITLTEDKVQIVEDTNYFDAKYIVPTTGSSNIGKIKDATSGNPKNGVLVVNNLDSLNIKAIRFLGFKNQSGSNGGSAWGFHTENITSDNIDTVTISDLHDYENGATTPIAVPIEINVPSGAKSFACTIRKMNNVVMTLQSFYCYLQTGEGVGDMIANVQPDEQLSTTSEKPIANKTITNFIFDNFTKEVEAQKYYWRPIKVSGDIYENGSNIGQIRVYPVTPGKQYIVTAYQCYYNNVTYAYAGFYTLPKNYGRSDISASTVCKGKDGNADAPYTYVDTVGKIVYVKDVILTAPEGATHLVLGESRENNSTEHIVEFPSDLKVVSVATEQQEEELVSESVKTALTPTPNALLMKNVLKSQNRNYYIESVDITGASSSFDSYTLKSYIDRKIATIPEGKHFMMWTDAHIDYMNNVGLQQDAIPVMAYIKEKLGISYIINGGDNLGVNSNKYKAAAIIEKYMIDCFEAFGRGLINVVGNHDWNKIDDNPKISDYEVWKRMFQPMEVFGDAVYAQNVLHNIETCELLTDDEKINLTAWAKMNYYIDDNKQKIRYYVSVTDDPGSIAQGSEMINGTSGNFMVFVDFFADALNSIPEGYDFVFVGHQRLVNDNRNENNPYWIFYKLMGAWKKKTNVSLGGGNSYDRSIFYGYKIRDNKVIAKWITSGNWDDNGLRTFDFSNHKGSGRVFTLGGHFHVDRAAFTSTDNRVFSVITYEDGINGNTDAGNILYDLGNPENNAYAEAWADAILGIDVHNTTLGGMSDTAINAQRVHRYEVNGEVVDEAYNDLGADWTGNEGKVYREYYEAGARKSVKFPNGGSNGSSFTTTVDGGTLETPATVTRLGTVNEICCDVITITDDNHVVCTRFGAGFDRDYKLPSIPSYSIYAESSEATEQTTENAGE